MGCCCDFKIVLKIDYYLLCTALQHFLVVHLRRRAERPLRFISASHAPPKKRWPKSEGQQKGTRAWPLDVLDGHEEVSQAWFMGANVVQ
jgi:hypothetical protein